MSTHTLRWLGPLPFRLDVVGAIPRRISHLPSMAVGDNMNNDVHHVDQGGSRLQEGRAPLKKRSQEDATMQQRGEASGGRGCCTQARAAARAVLGQDGPAGRANCRFTPNLTVQQSVIMS